MSGDDKMAQEGKTLESTKETGSQVEIREIGTSGTDEGTSEKAKVAQTRAERKKAKEREKDRKWAERVARVNAENEKYALKQEREAEAPAIINKITTERGALPR